MPWKVVGKCEVCKRPMFTDDQIDDKTGVPRVKASCECEKTMKDKILAPIVIPRRDRDELVLLCEDQGKIGGEGHVVVPMNYPLPEPADVTKRDMVFERTTCIKCGSHVVLQLVHNTRPPVGVTILNAEGEKAA